MRPMHALGLLAFAAPIPAQTVWIMGAPHTDLAVVINAAAPGDIVLLNGMQFAHFTLTKGLTMIGPGTIQPPALATGITDTTIAIPAGQSAHFAGVRFQSTNGPLMLLPQMVVVQGDVTFWDCTFFQGRPYAVDVSGNVMMHHCSASGSGWTDTTGAATGGCMRVHGGVCHLSDCRLDGTATWHWGQVPFPLPASPALWVTNGSTVHISHSALTGGRSTATMAGLFASPQPALIADGTVLLTDSTLSGGNALALPGAAGLVSNATTFRARTSVQGGSGTSPGPATTGSSLVLTSLVGLTMSQGWQLGRTSTLTATLGGTQLCAIFATFDSTPTVHPAVFGSIRGSLNSLVPLLVATPAGAQVSYSLAVPAVPTLRGIALFAQACQLDGGLVQASPAVGGAIR